MEKKKQQKEKETNKYIIGKKNDRDSDSFLTGDSTSQGEPPGQSFLKEKIHLMMCEAFAKFIQRATDDYVVTVTGKTDFTLSTP